LYLGQVQIVSFSGENNGQQRHGFLRINLSSGKAAFLPDDFRTTSGQLSDNYRTNLPDNEIRKTLDTKGLNRDSNYV